MKRPKKYGPLHDVSWRFSSWRLLPERWYYGNGHYELHWLGFRFESRGFGEGKSE